MKINSAVFEVSAPDLASCPVSARPEFAFIGRSNVGKSSLINLLSERRDLARVSDLPGKTRLINFFKINGRWDLVDLPGYGYAATDKRERILFTDAVSDYLAKRPNLRSVFVLIDSRHPPQAVDLDFLSWMALRPAPFVLVFTKTDKQSATQTQAGIERFKLALLEHRIMQPEIFRTSAKTKAGRGEILGYIERELANAAPAE